MSVYLELPEQLTGAKSARKPFMENRIKIGIDAISFYSSNYYIDLGTIADVNGLDHDFYLKRVGQEKMAILPPGEDVVTMAANAVHQVLEKTNADVTTISSLMFATESGIDQSKSGGIYVHRLVGLSKHCRVFEIKQACYGATAGLQMALSLINQNPEQKVLIVASDVARYGIGTPGEQTQGCGAMAMLISANPRIVAFEPQSGYYTEDAMDFWRPNYREEALVDGKSSVKLYVKSLLECWNHYKSNAKIDLSEFHRFCYHLPFIRMADIAHLKLSKSEKLNLTNDELKSQYADTLCYNAQIGNSYTASMYIAFISLLEKSKTDLTSKRIAFFSYGSGCMAEFFSGTMIPGYKQCLLKERHEGMLNDRVELTHSDYMEFQNFTLPQNGEKYCMPDYNVGSFRLTELDQHKRIYDNSSVHVKHNSITPSKF